MRHVMVFMGILCGLSAVAQLYTARADARTQHEEVRRPTFAWHTDAHPTQQPQRMTRPSTADDERAAAMESGLRKAQLLLDAASTARAQHE
jgi:hypothetical protein